jgi:putative addiction module component (TIGR02574 family)
MPLTVEQIVSETRDWPPQRVEELFEALSENLLAADPSVESEWKAEIERRVDEIVSGSVVGLPGEDVSARLRQSLKK